ncbi:hypothetical protein IQ283_09285 (plasmid) [Alkalihalobacillus hwajinpoensis]|uniref:capping complex subunit for YIEGIA n=1 Tax=Guptibacillus hwajinpoensis TaxID=208199 RepID=UPI001883EEB9|nr:hypothetical protein [Pseudalkalibacillus hwajinpoensis]MBF0706801.1 hypothetical protein [Pseudalkalibacillus hwajinpoensis]
MGRESSMKPSYEILAYLSTNKERILSGGNLCLYSENEKELTTMMRDIAKGLKADVVKLTNGDYMVIRI